jgi:hypothetical protein
MAEMPKAECEGGAPNVPERGNRLLPKGGVLARESRQERPPKGGSQTIASFTEGRAIVSRKGCCEREGGCPLSRAEDAHARVGRAPTKVKKVFRHRGLISFRAHARRC